MKKNIVASFLVAFMFLTQQASAATFYVDSTGGLDTNNGTDLTTAWQTIAKVNSSAFQPGDSVLFKKGSVWREMLSLPSSGTAGNPLTFGAYGTGNKPKITANNVAGGWNPETVTAGTDYTASNPPVSYWMFDDTSGPALDSSVNANNLSWGANSIASADRIEGNYSLSGSTTTSVVRLFSALSSNFPGKGATTAFTMGFWLKTDSAYAGNFFSLTNSSSQGYVFSTNGTGGLRFRIYGAPTTRTLDTNGAVNDGNWHHVVSRWDGTTVTLWIDGVKQTATGVTTSLTLVTASNLIATVGPNTAMDEAFVFSRSLTDGDITAIYNSGLNGARASGTNYYVSGFPTNPVTVIVDGQLIANVATKALLANNTWWYDSTNGRVYLHSDPTGHVVEIGTRASAITTNGQSYTVVDGFELEGGGVLGTYSIGSGSSNTTIQNSLIHNVFSGVQARGGSGSNQLVQNNVIHTGHAYGVVSSVTNSTGWNVIGNEIYNIGNVTNAQSIGSLFAQGIYFSVADALIDGNYLHDMSTTYSPFLHAIYVFGTTLTARNNTITNSPGYGIKIAENSNNAVIYNNVFYNTGAAIGMFGSTGASVYNNVMWGANNFSQSGRLAHAIYMTSQSGVNSTITLLKNNAIGDNLYFANTANQFQIDPNNTITNSDYNIFFSSTNPTGNVMLYQGNAYTLAQWQALGNDTHSTTSNPLFVATGTDWHLQPSSPAINAGTDVGRAFVGSAPDIGAYEFDAAPIISAITPTPSGLAVTITWTTDEASDSQVQYGPTTSYGTSTPVDSAMVTSHSVTISGLTAATTYNFRVLSKDNGNNTTTSANQTFTISATPVSSGGGGGGGGGSVTVYSGGTSLLPTVTTPTSTTPTTTTPTTTTATTPTTTTSTAPVYPFSRNLYLGVVHAQVIQVQKYLNAHGYIVAKIGAGSPGKEITRFGPATKKALIQFQKDNNIAANGYFGPITRAFIAAQK